MKHDIPVYWAYMILKHMASHDENSQELPYAFFIIEILQCFEVNLIKEDHVLMKDSKITVHLCNNKMGVIYNYKDKTIRYIDDEVENPPSVLQETEDMRNVMDYMDHMHHSLST